MNTPSLGHTEYAPLFHSVEVNQGRDHALMQQIFELRFQTYCLECGYLPASNYPNQRETDEYDARSSHFCTFNSRPRKIRFTQTAAGSRFDDYRK